MSKIISTQGVCGGELRIINHRITVKNVLDVCLDSKEGEDLILSTYPTLTVEDLKVIKEFLYKLIDKEGRINDV